MRRFSELQLLVVSGLFIFSALGFASPATQQNVHQDPREKEDVAVLQDRKDIASTNDEVRKTKTGKEFRRVSEEELRKQGLKDEGLKACAGENGKDGAWQEPDYQNKKDETVKGRIWCGAIGKKDGKETMTQQDARVYCRERGLELPTGYPDDLNGERGFPNEDSDHMRLTRSMGAKNSTGEGYSPYAQGSSSQTVLPNATQWFWSSTSLPGSFNFFFGFDGLDGALSYLFTNYQNHINFRSVRCVVARQ